MDWYPWYPTLYKADTMHLSISEDGAYRRLIDHYMETRQPLPVDHAALARIIGISNNDFQAIAEQVLNFFSAHGQHLHSKRCDIELDRQDNLTKKRSEAGKKGAEKRHKKQSLPSNCRARAEHTPSRGEERIGEEGTPPKIPPKKKKKQLTLMPSNWEPSEKALEYALKKGYTEDEYYIIKDQFRNNCAAKGREYKDWNAGLRTWIGSGYTRNDIDARRKRNGAGQEGSPLSATIRNLLREA